MTLSVRAQFSNRRLPPWPFPLTPTNHTHPPATIWWRTPEFAAEAPASGAGLGKIGHRFRHRFIVPSTAGICRQSTRHGTLQVHRARVGVGSGAGVENWRANEIRPHPPTREPRCGRRHTSKPMFTHRSHHPPALRIHFNASPEFLSPSTVER